MIPMRKERIASILERDATITIQSWLSRVENVGALKSIPMDKRLRTQHLPRMIKDITVRLRSAHALKATSNPSPAAVAHGQIRCCQGYSASHFVQEARALELSIFETIQRNLGSVDVSFVLQDIMLIADEVDSQLSQSIVGFLTMQLELAAA
jgi:hypothetical protein